MPISPTTKSPLRTKLEARCGKGLKLRILHAKKSTGFDEADFVVAAVEEFFARHRTPAAQIAAVIRSRTGADVIANAAEVAT